MRRWGTRTAGLALAGALALGGGGPSGAQTTADDHLARLRQRAADLHAALAGDVCANAAAVRALLGEPAGTAGGPPPPPSSAPPTAAPSSAAATATTPLPQKELAALLHQAVVLVIDAAGTGSGFFVGPDIVVTNHHVVEHRGNQGVFVIGQGLDGAKEAEVLATTGPTDRDQRDYAILRIKGAQAPAILRFNPEATELTHVVAAGFPAIVLRNDNNFKDLLNGDGNAIPELALSQGAIMAIQNRTRGMPTIVHTAPISGGNSGGPLVNLCGQVLGINTFISVEVKQASSAGFALPSPDLLAFLQSHGVTAQTAKSCMAGEGK